MSLADAYLVRMTELDQKSVVLTLDSDFGIYRRNPAGRSDDFARQAQVAFPPMMTFLLHLVLYRGRAPERGASRASVGNFYTLPDARILASTGLSY